MNQEIIVQTPTRIDFAGGTLDLPPLYLFHQPSFTVNAAISVFTTACIANSDPQASFSWKVKSKDQNVSLELQEADRTKDFTGHGLELPIRFLLQWGRGSGTLEVGSDAPRGSGLGASSSLALAIQTALDRTEGVERKEADLIEYVKNVETQVVRVPTGYQDFLAAYYRGVNIFSFDVSGVQRIPIEDENFLSVLEKHLLLVYTTPRFSGMNNWELFKRHIEQDKHILGFFERLQKNAQQARQAFLAKDITQIGNVMTQDWEDRKSMIPTMSTPLIEDVIAQTKSARALGWRVCGAGGGGCVAFLIASEQKERATEKLNALSGVRILPCTIVRR